MLPMPRTSPAASHDVTHPTNDDVALLAMAVFNIRREGLAMLWASDRDSAEMPQVIKGEQLAAFRAALQELPDQMRRCCLLRYEKGLKYQEIAVVMKISIETVKAHLHQARKRLAARLEAKGKRDPMELTFTALSRNLLNHPNLALPSGNLSSPVFGQSTSLVSGGGNNANGNRRIELQLKLSF